DASATGADSASGDGQGDYWTTRSARHWGLAAEAEMAPTAFGVSWKGGIAFRQLRQALNQHATIQDPGTPGLIQDYQETLRTDYMGAYLGLAKRFVLAYGFTASIAGEAGIYAASTSYDGLQTFTQQVASQHLSLSDNRSAVIA